MIFYNHFCADFNLIFTFSRNTEWIDLERTSNTFWVFRVNVLLKDLHNFTLMQLFWISLSLQQLILCTNKGNSNCQTVRFLLLVR